MLETLMMGACIAIGIFIGAALNEPRRDDSKTSDQPPLKWRGK